MRICGCSPEATTLGPLLTTRLRRCRHFAGMEDVEIRGLPGGEVKFVRNVATQYHVRIGCERQGPTKGRFEIMRVLQRWDVSSLPAGARVRGARLTLFQEDTSSFPGYVPLRWPTTFYLYLVRREWGGGRGGVLRDNLSPPEPGATWWHEARAGSESWRESGCGFASDTDPDADREAHPLAAAAVTNGAEPMVFSGPRLAAAIEYAASSGESFDVLVKASSEDERRPGSVKCFYSAEFGDDTSAEHRPELSIEWQAPTLWAQEHPIVLEPGTACSFPVETEDLANVSTLAAVVDLPETEGAIVPELEWIPTDESFIPGASLFAPRHLDATPAASTSIRVTTAVTPIALGQVFRADILQTWTPVVALPEDLSLIYQFTAPSTRSMVRRAEYRGEGTYGVEFIADELGVWRYRWRTRPDAEYDEQAGEGLFTVVRSPFEQHAAALLALVPAAVQEASGTRGYAGRCRQIHRLTALQDEFHRASLEALSAESAVLDSLRRALDELGRALAKVAI